MLAMPPRHALTNEQWERLQAVLPRHRPGPRSKLGDRLFIDAVLYRGKTGVPWRDLPGRFGPWKSVYNRFSNWASRGWWEEIFKALQLDVDESSCIVDGSVVRAHQDAGGGKGGSASTLWGALEEVELVAVARAAVFIGDTGYDSNKIRKAVDAKGMRAVIHPRPERKDPPPLSGLRLAMAELGTPPSRGGRSGYLRLDQLDRGMAAERGGGALPST